MELKRLKDRAGSREAGANVDPEQIFRALTKDREGLIRYSDLRFALHEDPARKLDELFDQYV